MTFYFRATDSFGAVQGTEQEDARCLKRKKKAAVSIYSSQVFVCRKGTFISLKNERTFSVHPYSFF
jgi:hypothetical protein